MVVTVCWCSEVYVFVFDKKGRLLIQRRSSAKKIGPNQWDLSVAEHLSKGELNTACVVCATSWHQRADVPALLVCYNSYASTPVTSEVS